MELTELLELRELLERVELRELREQAVEMEHSLVHLELREVVVQVD